MIPVEIFEKNKVFYRFFFILSFFEKHEITFEKKAKKTTKIEIFNF